MAILTIRLVPNPALFKKARKIAKITAQHKKLAQDMVETMSEHNGVGLAANQVGVLERICVVQTPDMEEAMILVNPEIVKKEGQREVEEGCLSVPGYRGMVIRSEWVRARALDLNSKTFKVEADELLAQALEHEIDHLNGIMYMDHLVAHTTVYKIQEAAERGRRRRGRRRRGRRRRGRRGRRRKRPHPRPRTHPRPGFRGHAPPPARAGRRRRRYRNRRDRRFVNSSPSLGEGFPEQFPLF